MSAPLKLSGLALAVLLVLCIAAAVLVAHYFASARAATEPPPRAAQPDRPGCLSIPTPGTARHPLT
jgi:hypothetical protein